MKNASYWLNYTNKLLCLMKPILRFLSLFILILGQITFTQAQSIAQESAVQPGSIIIKFKSSFSTQTSEGQASVPALQAVLTQLGATTLQHKFPHTLYPDPDKPGAVNLRLVYQLNFDAALPVEKVRRLLLQTNTLEYAEPIYQRQVLSQPNDPYADSTRADGQYYLKKIQAYRAWDYTQGDTSMVIGIVDTGAQFTHEDMVGKVKYNYADPIDGIDNDGDGYVDNFRGWDFVDRDNDPSALGNGHGLLVAGVAVGRANNGVGIAGIAHGCKYLPIRVFTTNNILIGGFEGIVYAADHGCKIINLSWGGPGGRSQFEQDVINYAAINRDAVIVAAAGNSNADLDFYPASYDHVISVAFTNAADVKTNSATYSQKVSLTAPGSDILTTWNRDDVSYAPVGGSSFASPIVAGVAALVRSRFPQYTADQVAAQLRQTADNIYGVPGNEAYLGKLGTGRVNAHRAVTRTDLREVRVLTTSFTPQRDIYLLGETLTLTAEVQNMLQPVSHLQVTASSLSPYLTVLSGRLTANELTTLERTANTSSPFQLQVASSTPVNTSATIKYHLTADKGYQSDQYLTIILNPGYVKVDAGDLQLTITGRGNLGYDGMGSNLGESVTYKKGNTLLWEGGLVVATSATRVSDRLHSRGGNTSQSFYALTQTALNNQSVRATQEAMGIFRDSLPDPARPRSVGLRIRQRAATWDTAPDRDYALVEYTLTNITADTLRPLHAGLFMDWDLPLSAMRNIATWDATRSLGYVYDPSVSTIYAGVKLLSGGTATVYSMDNNAPASHPVRPNDSNGFTRAEKFLTLSNGTTRPTAGLPSGADVAQVVGTALQKLAPGDSVKVAFAVLSASSLGGLQAAADAAQHRYSTSTVLPTQTAVATADWQVYPNPTTGLLHVEVPRELIGQEVRLLNTLGQCVQHQPLTSTSTSLDLSARAAGVYLVQVQGPGAATLTRRVVVQP